MAVASTLMVSRAVLIGRPGCPPGNASVERAWEQGLYLGAFSGNRAMVIRASVH
jgi:hypothetical protein